MSCKKWCWKILENLYLKTTTIIYVLLKIVNICWKQWIKRDIIIYYKLNKKTPGPSKYKEHYERFFLNKKTKLKKSSEASRTLKSLNNCDKKSVLKSIKQSNIIMQELQATEKPNIFDIESVTIEHWKTVTKLPKPKIITQLPNKIKTYIESKVADCTLQSDIIKT